MVDEAKNGQWENKDKDDMARANYRFGGERYGLRGTAHHLGDDYIPQINSLYPFPAGDAQDMNDNDGYTNDPENPPPQPPDFVTDQPMQLIKPKKTKKPFDISQK